MSDHNDNQDMRCHRTILFDIERLLIDVRDRLDGLDDRLERIECRLGDGRWM